MSLKDSLFTDSQAKVYAWIFGQPNRSYHLSELTRLTGLASASLQREVNRMARAGLVTSEMVGNQRRISANMQSPVFEELYQLTRKTMGAEPLLREALRPLSDKIALALIYGSVAKGSDTSASDIDLLIVSDTVGLGDVLEHCHNVETQLGRKVNPNCYTLAEFNKRRQETDSFVQRVLAQPIILLFGELHVPHSTREPRKNRTVKNRKTSQR
jgi:predicted nucleotidyltransferase